ncbi:MAG: 4-(cytidine 5'-diphospho)-2-C-methyl-D-erythritol kinase [Lachnospiraceae bacterium]|jgi:4-diphosphocytidyl-2-C-methyl-D-erythritol kinase|nr:4-(cytidine 5'-diphospho)-2-C-methyl-D-erythritol kinase [Lachnospiraceae bacterium]
MSESLQLKAYAKINLGLDVVGRRENGYHDVRMIMQTITLFDKLTFKVIEEDEIRISTNLSFLSPGENNLVYKAIKLIKDTHGIKQGMEVDLFKCIPVAAGMAGGSTDCAAALYGASKLFGLNLSKQELMDLGVKLGADVPYCVMRGTALSEGIGEILTPLSPMPDCNILVAKPSISVSTKFVYEHLDAKESYEHPDIDGMIGAINSGDLQGIADRLGNVLETVTVPEYPVIDDIKTYMKEHGALNALMSGSGPTVFGIYENEDEATAAKNALLDSKLAKNAFVVKPYNIGN